MPAAGWKLRPCAVVAIAASCAALIGIVSSSLDAPSYAEHGVIGIAQDRLAHILSGREFLKAKAELPRTAALPPVVGVDGPPGQAGQGRFDQNYYDPPALTN
jgi:hypothetical protein